MLATIFIEDIVKIAPGQSILARYYKAQFSDSELKKLAIELVNLVNCRRKGNGESLL